MYLSGLSRLGQWDSLVGTAASMFTGGGKGGTAGAAPGTSITVPTTTTVATQISPQISPVFVQQQSPQNSPVNAGAAMQPTGYVPAVGSLPGFDYASGAVPGTQFPMPSVQAGGVPPMALALAAGIIGLAIVLPKKKHGRRR